MTDQSHIKTVWQQYEYNLIFKRWLEKGGDLDEEGHILLRKKQTWVKIVNYL